MPNIRVDSSITIYSGQPLTFRSPVDCSQITGLIVYYPDGESTVSRVFQFADSHGNNVGDLDLFSENVVVKVILDLASNCAFVQNADTNAYLESKFSEIDEAIKNATPKDHQHPASNITAGTFAGQVIANSNGQDPSTYLVRNQKLSATEETPTVNGHICWVYE